MSGDTVALTSRDSVDWLSLFKLADEQHVFPMIFDAAWRSTDLPLELLPQLQNKIDPVDFPAMHEALLEYGLHCDEENPNVSLHEVTYTSPALRIKVLAASFFRIAHKYLTLRAIPAPFDQIKKDVLPLLGDILSGGVYGKPDESGPITYAC